MANDSGGSVAVRRNPPPAVILRVMNPIFSGLLRSPLHGLVDKTFMLFHLTGRKSGRRFSIVVSRHEIDGVLTVMTGSPWRLNTRGGADVEVTSDGHTWPARAELVEDADVVAAAYLGRIEQYGWKASQRRLGVTTADGHLPTHDEMLDAVRRDHLALIRVHLTGR